LSLGPVAKNNDMVFEVARQQDRVAEYIRIGDRPFWQAFKARAVQVTLAGTREILDIDAPCAVCVRWTGSPGLCRL
jgi:hypothetical protein